MLHTVKCVQRALCGAFLRRYAGQPVSMGRPPGPLEWLQGHGWRASVGNSRLSVPGSPNNALIYHQRLHLRGHNQTTEGSPAMSTQLPEKSCPVCGAKHRRLLSLCGKHERRLERHGSVDGRSIRSEELKEYRPIASGLLWKYRHEQSIIAGHALMEHILRSYGADAEHASVGRKMRPHLDALLDSGATAQTAMIELLALAFYWQCEDRYPTAAEMDSQLCMRLLRHTRRGPRTGLRRKVVAGLGYQLRGYVVPLLFGIHAHWKKSEDALQVQRKAALTFAPTF
jgi:hypothetical protein